MFPRGSGEYDGKFLFLFEERKGRKPWVAEAVVIRSIDL